jgi:hypothetical protein
LAWGQKAYGSFRGHKGSKKSKDTNKATRVAKQSANAAISASLNETFENEDDSFENNAVIMTMTPLRMKV